MATPRLEVHDALGRRVVPIDKAAFGIGRRESNDLKLAGSEVSRDHAEIVDRAGRYVLRDVGSRYGTFVNGDTVVEHQLAHGDRIRLGRSGGVELVFLFEGAPGASLVDSSPSTSTRIGDLRQVAILLEGLRALGSGHVLDEVLALVLDSAIEVGGAERGFIMLEGASGGLEFKLARGRGRVLLPGQQFETSRKIPEEVFETGESRMVADLLDGDLAQIHTGTVALGIRNILCVPLKLVRYMEQADAALVDRRIGVLYLDSREKGLLLSETTRAALETLATEAAVAIENARLYRETLEKARLEQEMRIAAEIQRALLPPATRSGPNFSAASASIACRSIGGDFFDYVDLAGPGFGFALGDVSGKGPPAALLSAMLQGLFAAQVFSTDTGPAESLSRMNSALLRRSIGSRYATLVFGVLHEDGRLVYCNAGHNPPMLFRSDGVLRLQTGGTVVGLFDGAGYEEETVVVSAGDVLVLFSDGVTEALNAEGEEFGEARLVEYVQAHVRDEPRVILDGILAMVREFAAGAPQNDDVTAMVVQYGPPPGPHVG